MRTILFKDLNAAPSRPHVALTRLPSRRVSARHKHDFYEVFLITSGSGIHHINAGKVGLSAGSLVAILPKDRHHFSSHSSEELAILNVAIPSAWWRQFHQLMGESIPRNWFRCGTPAGHIRLGRRALQDIQTAFEQLAGRDNRPPADLVGALLQVAASFLTKDQPAALVPPPWLERWRHAMADAREAVSVPLAYWQKQSGCSPEHLARSCRAFYQCTPTDLLNDVRIERAKAQLCSTDDKVISIGFACGFGNLSNFYRNFLARTGVTPTVWRRQRTATVPLGSE